jgi:hypothetical protein
MAEERSRVGKLRAAQESQLFAWQAEHAKRVHDWQVMRSAYEHQKRWYGVTVPGGIQRVDVAGGTLSGWSAVLTTAAAPRLAAGAEVTVLDLTEGAVALDLIAFARTSGLEPLVWVLPEDLHRPGRPEPGRRALHGGQRDRGTGLHARSLVRQRHPRAGHRRAGRHGDGGRRGRRVADPGRGRRPAR